MKLRADGWWLSSIFCSRFARATCPSDCGGERSRSGMKSRPVWTESLLVVCLGCSVVSCVRHLSSLFTGGVSKPKVQYQVNDLLRSGGGILLYGILVIQCVNERYPGQRPKGRTGEQTNVEQPGTEQSRAEQKLHRASEHRPIVHAHFHISASLSQYCTSE